MHLLQLLTSDYVPNYERARLEDLQTIPSQADMIVSAFQFGKHLT